MKQSCRKHGAITVIPRLRGFFRRLREDSVSAFAAQSAFFALLATVPFMLLLLTAAPWELMDMDEAGEAVSGVLPPLLTEFFQSALSEEMLSGSSGGITVISVITAVWSSSRGTFAVIQGLNSVCRVKENRGYFRLRAHSALYTLIFAGMLIVALFLMLFGMGLDEKLQSLFPGKDWLFLVIGLRSVISAALLTGLFLLIFTFLPAKKEKLRTRLPGALGAAGGWIAFTGIFSFYASHMADYSRLYGGLAAVAVIMLWLYFCMYILFLGAELNEFLENAK